jgi:hypothetical protein
VPHCLRSFVCELMKPSYGNLARSDHLEYFAVRPSGVRIRSGMHFAGNRLRSLKE